MTSHPLLLAALLLVLLAVVANLVSAADDAATARGVQVAAVGDDGGEDAVPAAGDADGDADGDVVGAAAAAAAAESQTREPLLSLARLDHVNLRTRNLAAMISFYEELGLRVGYRPPFDFPGAWLYVGERAVLHLVEDKAALGRAPLKDEEAPQPQLEHFALSAEGGAKALVPFTKALQARSIDFRLAMVSGDSPLRQVHVQDPDGNHVEVQFQVK